MNNREHRNSMPSAPPAAKADLKAEVLSAPNHVPADPEVKEEPREEKPAPQSPKGIEVVALRAGFVNKERIREGDVFRIDSESQLGSWMAYTDQKKEKARREAEQKAKRNK